MFKIIFSRRMIVAFIMGFACGLPLLLTITVLQAWMKEEGVDLTIIGLFALVGLPYTLKFLWAPFLDRFIPPFLGRRRGWMLIAQIFLMVSIGGLAMTSPADNPWIVAVAAMLVTFFSASQDIVVDAYRREDLRDEELGLGSSFYINGYRLGMLLASGGGLIMADFMSFKAVYLIMAACMLPGIITTLFTPEPVITGGTPASMREAVFDPLIEYFSRNGALWMLAFILFYKVGDTMASAMTIPFYLDIGFSKTEIGAVVKLFGFWATIAGGLIGGVTMLRMGINRSLWVFGFLQAISTAGFALLAWTGYNLPLLAGVIAFENLSAGMGTAAYVAFMASITDKRFTATQYALLSSLMGIPRVIASAPTGFLAKHMGWMGFFIACTLIAIPGMLLLLKFAPWRERES
ncbi:MAG TPA: MFS transporter [Nitrospirae bacterium]|nr:MFS transporter [Nitrospirota bacterium]HDZ84200.1 MFS transporter [Nitrospirota bacterium]